MPHDPNYIDQEPSALRLTLIEGRLDPSQFPVYTTTRLQTPSARISARIIGASHLITYRCGPLVLNEVFACIGLEDVTSWSLDELEAASVVRDFGRFHYEFTAWNEPWSDPEPPALVDLVAAVPDRDVDPSGIGTLQQFPQGKLLVTPKTVVVGSVDGQTETVVIETAHSYPNVGGLVLSRSVLTHT